MMRVAHGFLADDGSFHESKLDCQLHEAERALIDTLQEARIDPAKLMPFLSTNASIVQAFVETYIKKKARQHATDTRSTDTRPTE